MYGGGNKACDCGLWSPQTTLHYFTIIITWFDIYIYLYVWPTTSHQYKWTAQLLLNLHSAQVAWNMIILLFRRGFRFSFLFTTLRCIRSSHPCRLFYFGVGGPLLTKPFFIAVGFARKPTRNKYLQDAITNKGKSSVWAFQLTATKSKISTLTIQQTTLKK